MPEFVFGAPSTEALSGNPYELAAWAFQNAWVVAQNKSSTSDALFQQALTAGGAAPSMSPAQLAFDPSVVEPLVNIPQFAEGASVAKFYELSTAVINQLAGVFRTYMDEFFPDDQPYLRAAETWITNAITNGGTGLLPHIEQQIWNRDVSRISREASRAEKEVRTAWAAKGYPLPPGAATYQVLQVRRDAMDKIAQASRDVAIKQADMEQSNVQFAVAHALDLYSKAMGAAMDYVKALAVGPQSGMQVIPSITDSQAKLISAASDYYRARISVRELALKANMPNSEWDQQARIKNGDWVMAEIKTRVDAAISAAQSLGTQAASALNSLHASTQVSGSRSNQVGYQYGGDVSADVPPITSV